MIYLDTNIFIYALSKNVDDISQKEKALKLLRETIEKDELIISEIILYEFAFVSNKIGEEAKNISENLEFLEDFIQLPSVNLSYKVLEFMNDYKQYKHSFDVYHIVFAKEVGCSSFVTYDKGFKRLQKYTDLEILVL